METQSKPRSTKHPVREQGDKCSELPARVTPQSPGSAVSSPSNGRESVPRGKPITILMADDDSDDRMLTGDAFTENRLLNELRFVEGGE